MPPWEIVWLASISAATIGLMGGVHCIGMCGLGASAILGAAGGRRELGDSLPVRERPSIVVFHAGAGLDVGARFGSIGNTLANLRPRPTMVEGSAYTLSLAFNLGRLSTYVLMGTLLGGVSAAASGVFIVETIAPLRLIALCLAQILIVYCGLTILGQSRALASLERVGTALWSFVRPFVQSLSRQRSVSVGDAVKLGALWGWIPCGLVYSALTYAMAIGASAGTIQAGSVVAAMVMFAFGIGTLPVMLAVGAGAGWLTNWFRSPRLRATCGYLLVGVGVFGLVRALSGHDAAALAIWCSTALR